MRTRNALRCLLVMALLLLPSLAMAQIFGAEIPDDDVSVSKLLNPLFGELVGKGGGDDPLVSLIKVFNAGVLTLGGILVFYTLVAGTLSTAHDGEMLGKRWSSVWVPIRTTLGAAAIMPTIGGGYAAIQAVVMWLALQGVSMANVMWSGYLAQDPMESAFYVPPGGDRQIRQTFQDMFMSNVCTSAFQQSQQQIGVFGKSVNLPAIPAAVVKIGGGGTVGYAYGPHLPSPACGSVLLKTGVATASGDPAGTDGPASAAALVDATGMNAALSQVHQKHLGSAQAKLKQMADQLVTEGLDQATFDTTLDSLVITYLNDLKTTAHAQYTASQSAIRSKLIEGMKRDGWAMAGMYYMSMVRSMDEITRAISQSPSTSTGQISGTGGFLTDVATQSLGGAIRNWATNKFVSSGERDAWLKAGQDLVDNSNNANLSSVEQIADDATGKSWVMKFVSWFMNDDMAFFSVDGAASSQFSQQGQNPIIMAKNVGENMTSVAWAGFGIGSVALGLSGVGAGVAGAWAEVFAGPLMALFALLVVPGATLSTYVPMIPYILWLGVVVGWLILIVEAIIAAPIWAVSHMAPDGDGVVGRGGQGYMLVLSLVLRPPLMIIGLVCAISLMKPLGYFINSTFLGAFAIGVNPGPAALTQLIAGCILYVVVMVSVIHRVFTLIHYVPDRILRWIGGGGNDLGEQAQGIESFSAAKTIGAAAAMNQIGHVSQSVGQGIRALNLRRADKANADNIRAEEGRSRMAQVEANENDQAYRAGQEAYRASASAQESPNDLSARQRATVANTFARDARLSEAEVKAGHVFEQEGFKGGLGAFRDQSLDARESAVAQHEQSNPRLAEAMRFANDLDRAREAEAVNPESGAMAGFLNSRLAEAQQKGASARSWDVAAAKAAEFEHERQVWSQPPADPGEPPPKPE